MDQKSFASQVFRNQGMTLRRFSLQNLDWRSNQVACCGIETTLHINVSKVEMFDKRMFTSKT